MHYFKMCYAHHWLYEWLKTNTIFLLLHDQTCLKITCWADLFLRCFWSHVFIYFLIATLWWLHCSALVSAAPLQHKDSGFKPGSLLKCACSVCAPVFRRVVWFPPTVPFTCRLISDSTLVIDADVLSMKWLMCIEGVSASEWLNVTGSVQCIKWSLRLEKSSYINNSPFPLVLSLSHTHKYSAIFNHLPHQ